MKLFLFNKHRVKVWFKLAASLSPDLPAVTSAEAHTLHTLLLPTTAVAAAAAQRRALHRGHARAMSLQRITRAKGMIQNECL